MERDAALAEVLTWRRQHEELHQQLQVPAEGWCGMCALGLQKKSEITEAKPHFSTEGWEHCMLPTAEW